ncbi:uncharacterized protein LOC114292325 isoform X2 [Camellia sinensis]|uniref:uncharacterized protein LOC114292325 isoform X2 n=1 Tax=Camellia sinensis TaxID=4442 RepID=UPI0010362F65|nr:uncharacterized protein LOC114292325 isoform X2 [Camellia sinensis]
MFGLVENYFLCQNDYWMEELGFRLPQRKGACAFRLFQFVLGRSTSKELSCAQLVQDLNKIIGASNKKRTTQMLLKEIQD